MYCLNCGKMLLDGGRFCPGCGTPLHETVPEKPAVRYSKPSQLAKPRKKHPVLIVFFLLIIGIGFLVVSQYIKENKSDKKPPLKTYDYGAFTIDLPDNMEEGHNYFDLGNDTVNFNQDIKKNNPGLTAEEYAKEMEASFKTNNAVSDVKRSGTILTYTSKDIAGLPVETMCSFYTSGDNVIMITLSGRKGNESYFRELLDTVKIK
ncbi:MAG: zinc ribbon domain-containing protein [Oscillospiraceae bacterium]|nr:zinc ribbon domain-containing protein [Oscillospiraceae bacterium]